MPRRLRIASGGYVDHVLHRAVGWAALFRKEGDYAAFEKVLRQAPEFQPMRLLAYCLMPNHWHLVDWPKGDGDDLVDRNPAARTSRIHRASTCLTRWRAPPSPNGSIGHSAPARGCAEVGATVDPAGHNPTSFQPLRR